MISRTKKGLLAAAMTTATGVLAAGAIYAGTGTAEAAGCDAGHFCLWNDPNFSGKSLDYPWNYQATAEELYKSSMAHSVSSLMNHTAETWGVIVQEGLISHRYCMDIGPGVEIHDMRHIQWAPPFTLFRGYWNDSLTEIVIDHPCSAISGLQDDTNGEGKHSDNP